MRRQLAIALSGAVVAVTALGLTAGVAGAHHHLARSLAVAQCRAERSAIGPAAFRAKYGVPHAFARCVRAHRPANRAAAQQCRDERRAIGPAAFRAKYGVPHAFRRCVQAKGGVVSPGGEES
ncbi:MAG: hypothetical protein E6G56_01965 [Actinobacteria bacterium]|nr:MAG: hypothetical protein E6G56_01965 [Actinomycetota bacterium]